MDDAEKNHYLDSYLSEILPQLGLDTETYAPYVTGYANNKENESISDDDHDDLDDLIDLLRASSESHGDDDAAWEEFRTQIVRRRKDHLLEEDARKVCFGGHWYFIPFLLIALKLSYSHVNTGRHWE